MGIFLEQFAKLGLYSKVHALADSGDSDSNSSSSSSPTNLSRGHEILAAMARGPEPIISSQDSSTKDDATEIVQGQY